MCLWRYGEIWLVTKVVISNYINNLLYSNSRWESSLFSLVLTYKNLHNIVFEEPLTLFHANYSDRKVMILPHKKQQFVRLPSLDSCLIILQSVLLVHCPLFWHSCLPVDPCTGPSASPYPGSLHPSHYIPIWSLPGHCQKGLKASLS